MFFVSREYSSHDFESLADDPSFIQLMKPKG